MTLGCFPGSCYIGIWWRFTAGDRLENSLQLAVLAPRRPLTSCLFAVRNNNNDAQIRNQHTVVTEFRGGVGSCGGCVQIVWAELYDGHTRHPRMTMALNVAQAGHLGFQQRSGPCLLLSRVLAFRTFGVLSFLRWHSRHTRYGVTFQVTSSIRLLGLPFRLSLPPRFGYSDGRVASSLNVSSAVHIVQSKSAKATKKLQRNWVSHSAVAGLLCCVNVSTN